MRLLQATCAPTTRELCNRTRRVIARYSNAFPPDVGASLKTWAVRPCFCVRPRAITSMVTCCWLMVVGWGDDLEWCGKQQRRSALNFSPLGSEGEIQSALARLAGALQKKWSTSHRRWRQIVAP